MDIYTILTLRGMPNVIINFFLIVLTGFVAIWTFRYFTNSEKTSGFEYFMQSTFVGLLLFAFFQIVGLEKVFKDFANIRGISSYPYLLIALIPLVGGFLGMLVGSLFLYSKNKGDK